MNINVTSHCLTCKGATQETSVYCCYTICALAAHKYFPKLYFHNGNILGSGFLKRLEFGT